MTWQTGIKNLLDPLVFRKKIGNCSPALIMSFHTHRQSLDPAENQPAFKGRKDRSRYLLDESKFFGLLRPGAYDHSPEPIAVAIQELSRGVHDHVSAQRKRLLEIGRHKRVVDHQLYLLTPAYLRHGADIGQGHQGIGRGLNVDHSGALANRAFHLTGIGRVHICEFQPIIRQHLVEQSWNSAIEVMPADHMIPRLEHRAQRVDRSHPTRENTRGYTALE